MKTSSFEKAKVVIFSFFDTYTPSVFSYLHLATILDRHRNDWNLPLSLSSEKFVSLLLETKRMKLNSFRFPTKKIRRFVWNKVSFFQLALNLAENAYFSHHTALALHHLNTQEPKMIYINSEQAKKKAPRYLLLQKNIDLAFSKPQRLSKNIAIFDKNKICLLNGKFTNKLGVIELTASNKEKVFVTDIERTLIDISVRPAYADGVDEVLKAYRFAKDKISIDKLIGMLEKINYIYPYIQTIGFYLEKVGIDEKILKDISDKVPFGLDFYLIHNMKKKLYSKRWRLFYPAEI